MEDDRLSRAPRHLSRGHQEVFRQEIRQATALDRRFLLARATAVDETIPRRRFLKAAGAAGTAGILAGGLPGAAQGQPRSSAPVERAAHGPADLVLKHGKVITVDTAFTIAQAIAISGDRIL